MWLRPKDLVTRSRRFLKPQLFSRIRVDGAKSQGWFCAREGGGGGGTLYDGLYGEAPFDKGIFFRLQVYDRVGISLVKVYKRVRKSVICERARKG